MYLAAYSMGLGATGLTSFDDKIVAFFEPHARGRDDIFIVALGRTARIRSAATPVRIRKSSISKGRRNLLV